MLSSNFLVKRILFPLVLLLTTRLLATEEIHLPLLFQEAEKAMFHADYLEAKNAYHKILKKVNSRIALAGGWVGYSDLIFRLARCHLFLQEIESGKEILQTLLSRRPPPEIKGQAKLMLAHFYIRDHAPEIAYTLMKEVLNLIAFHEWKAEERSFFYALESHLNASYDKLLKKANRLFVSGFYEEACTAYTHIAEGIEKGFFPKASHPHSFLQQMIQYKNIQSRYFLQRYQQVVKKNHYQFLMSLALSTFHEQRRYADVLESLLQKENPSEEDLHILLERGLFFYRAENMKTAKIYFEKIVQAETKTTKLSMLARLHLAKIFLNEEHACSIEKLLAPASAFPSLKQEANYLLGKAAYQEKNYVKAAAYLETSLDKKMTWHLDAMYDLILCYLNIAESSFTEKNFFLDKAAFFLNKLLHTKEKKKAKIGLGKLALQDEKYLKDDKETFLLEHYSTLSLEEQMQTLLLLAKEKASYYEEATHAQFAQTPGYLTAWAQKGLLHLQEEKTISDKAIHSFEQLFSLIETPQKEMLTILPLLEQALFMLKDTDTEKAVYLKAVLICLLEGNFSSVSLEKHLLPWLSLHPDTPWAEKALYLLATATYRLHDFTKAEKFFLQFVSLFPSSTLAADAYLKIASIRESSHHPFQVLYRYIYTNYPEAHCSAEAYFRSFPLEDYLKGKKAALEHLHMFSSCFSDTPWLVIAYYFLHTHAQELELKKYYYNLCSQTFQNSVAQKPSPLSIFFYYETLFQHASYLIKQDFIEEGIAQLKSIVEDFKTNPLTHLFKCCPYSPLLEKTEFLLVTNLLKIKNLQESHKFFSQMAKRYEQANKIQENVFSQLWTEPYSEKEDSSPTMSLFSLLSPAP